MKAIVIIGKRQQKFRTEKIKFTASAKALVSTVMKYTLGLTSDSSNNYLVTSLGPP